MNSAIPATACEHWVYKKTNWMMVVVVEVAVHLLEQYVPMQQAVRPAEHVRLGEGYPHARGHGECSANTPAGNISCSGNGDDCFHHIVRCGCRCHEAMYDMHRVWTTNQACRR